MIVFDNVTKQYAGAATAVNGLSLTAPKRQADRVRRPFGLRQNYILADDQQVDRTIVRFYPS